MNLSALKTFAPEVRRQLMEAIGRKLDFVLTGDTADLRAAAEQVAHLRSQADADRKGLIERVAYTWFNRLAALRFIDAHPGWHPFRANVVTAANAEETQPELLKLTRSGALPAELLPFTNPQRLNDLLDGHLPSSDPQGEVYRHLILAVCRFYHDLMPFLFEALDDETELLLPDDLLTEHSIAHGFRTGISAEDCSEVELLGWLYQFYISEKKDQVMARKSAVPSEDIPAVTQLFTPHWIVRYLVENSLGRLWLHSRPGSRLREHMPYYVDDPEGQASGDSLTVARPEEIKLLDPASGSGHMLTYSFDLLYRIYEEEGHAPSEIPALILQHNLYGLDICPRAVQLAQFALICKAREKSRTAFRNPIQPQVMCLEDVVITLEEMAAYLELPEMRELFTEKVLLQVHQFRENTSTFGSLIQPVLTVVELAKLKSSLSSVDAEKNTLLQQTHKKLLHVIEQAEMLSQQYHVVVANPPYMGGKMNPSLSQFLVDRFCPSRTDLSAVFISRSQDLCLANGTCALVAMHSWMFLESLEGFRKNLLSGSTILTIAHFGIGAFPTLNSKVVQTAALVFRCKAPQSSHVPICDRLLDYNPVVKEQQLISGVNRFRRLRQSAFFEISGCPVAYWLSTKTIEAFGKNRKVVNIGEIKSGIMTGNDPEFIRRWHEVAFWRIGICHRSAEDIVLLKKKWFPINRGGDERRWYGNNLFLINLEDKGLDIRSFGQGLNYRLRDEKYYFRPGITWGRIGNGRLSTRYSPQGFVFGDAGTTAYFKSENDLYLALGTLLSNSSGRFLEALAPTMNFQVYHIEALPFPCFEEANKQLSNQITANVIRAINVARDDWDNFETSWDFRDQPLLRPVLKGATMEASWRNWAAHNTAAIRRMQELETENNRLFVAAYGLDDELQPEVPEGQITLARPDRRKDIAAFLSYAVGCMMGRYSLDSPGLILANAGDTLEQYLAKVGKPLDQLTFTPDEDCIIPVLDGEWFEDDIVARTRDFLRATFGDATLETNLHFIEESLGKDLRKYFLTDFYKDHLQTYKKRPIYWLFQSPKKGFNALVYLHRYTKDTPNRLLSNYLRDFLHKLRARLEHLDHLMASESTPAREVTKARKESDQLKKTLRECEDYEREILLPLAQQRIELDLDEGVKVNYLKLGAALATIPGLAAKEDE